MTFHANFLQMRNDLGTLLVSTAAQYANSEGLDRMNEISLRHMSLDPSNVAGEFLMHGCDAWPESARELDTAPALTAQPVETFPSETDPPRTIFKSLIWSLGTLIVTVPLAYSLVHFLGNGGYFTFAFGVLTVAMVFGTGNGVLLGAVSPVVNNLFVIDPALTFTVPTRTEVTMGVFYIATAIVMPWIATHAYRWRQLALEGRISPSI
jgi:hypothetical protein